MVERALPDRRTAMTPVALAAAITRTGGRRVEAPYLPRPAPPPRSSRMRRRRGRARAHDSGRARGRRRGGATPGVDDASCASAKARRAANARLGCGARSTSASRRRLGTRKKKRGALFRVSANKFGGVWPKRASGARLGGRDDVGGRAQRAVVSQSGHGDRWRWGV